MDYGDELIPLLRHAASSGRQAAPELLTAAVTAIERLRAAGKRALDHYDMRGELYTNDADAAGGMADILRQTFNDEQEVKK